MEEHLSLWARVLGQIVYQFTQIRPLLPTYAHLIASALFPIYTGAHASLTRPTSAAKPIKRKSKGQYHDGDDDDTEEEEEEEHRMEGLAPSDAIMMPLFAGCALAGLYFLIKWLEDPAILNKILNWYFAAFGFVSVSRLITDALDISHSILFPQHFVRGGTLYRVDQKKRMAAPLAKTTEKTMATNSPLPGFLSNIPLSENFRKFLWDDRAMPSKKWTLRLYVHRLFAGKILLGPHGMLGALGSLLALVYFNAVAKPWYLTNLIGFGFSYAALQLMSPTTFATGSLILSALFFYDIFFVFYTPMMVTVAQSLDAPIKLVFPRPASDGASPEKLSFAMLGLGDVVLPGIMIGLALRFDLFLFYLRQQKRVPSTDGSRELVTKPRYFSLAGRWSDQLWTHSIFGRPLWKSHGNYLVQPFTFPKTYFKASLTGYIFGMLATLGVMHIWGHAQPALLYLVPGVLGSLWLTALVRGELSLMWNFSEAVDEEDDIQMKHGGKDKQSRPQSEQKRNGFFSFSDQRAQEMEERARKVLSKHVQVDSEEESETKSEEYEGPETSGQIKAMVGHKSRREMFSLSIEAPWDLKHPRSLIKSKVQEKEAEKTAEEKSNLQAESTVWVSSSAIDVETEEHSGKRIRVG